MAPPTRTPRSRWIEAGLQALAEGGPDAVRIEPMAETLGVTRGGFYGQFKDRRALLDELLETWERSSVDEVIELVESQADDASDRLRVLLSLSDEEELLRTDLAVRDWSRHDDEVAKRLRRVDNRRIDYLRSLFRPVCSSKDEVEVRCMITFSLWIGNPFIAADHGTRSRAQVLEMAYQGLLRSVDPPL